MSDKQQEKYYVVRTNDDGLVCDTQDEAVALAEVEIALGNFVIVVKGNIVFMS